MAHEFSVKEVALQAGMSTATVDRVLHKRAGVRLSTQLRVQQAMRELKRQSAQRSVSGRKYLLDLVMETPDRFSALARKALEAEMPLMAPAAFSARSHLGDVIAPKDMALLLRRIAKRGSHGVLLKAQDVPEVRAAVNALTAAGIPVLTLVTDITQAGRTGYIGIDNRAAGQTAAYLVGQWMGGKTGKILLTLSSNRFRGEEEREAGFKQALRLHYPHLSTVDVSEGFGRDRAIGILVREALAREPQICGVYSIGGGNAAIVAAFESEKRDARVFIGHDLDEDNRELLQQGKLSAVLHHDLRADMRRACLAILSGIAPELSQVLVITPFNLAG